MNPDDYDDDGNNIVPCPICMSKYCPSKEDGKCPGEDMFALEGEIRMLLSEYKETGDNSRIVNVLEAVEHLLTEKAKELQKAREEMLHKLNLCAIGKYEGDALENVKAQIKEYQSELDQPIS